MALRNADGSLQASQAMNGNQVVNAPVNQITQPVQTGSMTNNATGISTGVYSSGPTAPISASFMNAPITQAPIPTKPLTPIKSGAANDVLGSLGYTNVNGVWTQQINPQTDYNTAFTTGMKQAQDYLGAPKSEASAVQDVYGVSASQAGTNQKSAQDSYNSIKNQIVSINNNAAADKLALTGQGRGIPEPIIGGQQAEIDKQATIQTLRLAPLLDAAQGNLDVANKRVDQYFTALVDDAKNDYTYRKDVFNVAKDYADKQQTNALNAATKQDDRNFQMFQDATKDTHGYVTAAYANGDTKGASDLLNIKAPDFKSPTFKEDLAKYNSDVAAAVATLKPDTLRALQISKAQVDLQKAINDAKTSSNPTVSVVNDAGNTVTIPTNVAPYYNVASNGVEYVDASTLQGTAAEKTQIINDAQKAGYKIITNSNTAADLVNIKDAKDKLNTVQTTMAGIGQPGWVSRLAGGLGMTALETATQSDPQKAAAGALQSIGLDVLKAISGVQGFRGNQSAIQQVTDHLPKITDTVDTINQKVKFINDLVNARENAIVGQPKAVDTGVDQTVNGVTYSKGADGLYYPKK